MMTALLSIFSKIYPMAKRGLYNFHGGVFPSHNKSISKRHPVHARYIPKQLVLPLQQHIGIETETLVKVGDRVFKNQLLADTQKGLSAPVHAPTSGTIIAIEKRTLPHASGLQGTCIVIETDQQDKAIENSLQVDGNTPDSPEALKNIIHQAGIVGMGGAGYPTFAKLPKQKHQIQTLLVNGAECEPFITCDDVLMQNHPEQVVEGALIVAEALGCERVLCGIEDNKPDAIEAMRAAAHNTIFEVHPVPTVYPMGGQKQLIQELLQTEIPAHLHAVDVGLLMMNVATFAAIYQAVRLGNPLTSRLVTVSGLGLKEPFNIDALLGTPFAELAELAQPSQPINYPLIQGGPMMGVEMPTNWVPVVKVTNCVLANPPEPSQDPMPCIRCGECMDACPINLLPQQMYWHSRSHEFERVEKLKVFDCIECGCCSFVCPSHIPLVQYYRFSKSQIKLARREEAAAELAKQRHEAKLAREERLKQEREARLKAKKDEVKRKAAQTAQNANTETTEEKPKASGAAAAAARAAAARKKSQASSADSTQPATASRPMTAREKAIAAAQKRAQKTQSTKTKSQGTAPVSTKTDTPESKPMTAREKAIAAAKKRAQKTQSSETSPQKSALDSSKEDTNESKPMTAREKAIAAAKKRAQQAKTTAKDSAEAKPTEPKKDSKKDPRQAAMAAAKKQAAARKAKQQAEAATNTPEEDAADSVTKSETADTSKQVIDKRQAAIEAARKRAAQKKQQNTAQASQTSEQNQTDSEPVEMTAQEKRQAAMAAAKKRAQTRKAEANKSTESSE